MNEIIMLPTASRKTMNLQEFAEDATVIIEDTIIRTPSHLHFIEANTSEVTLQHLRNECVVPVFAKDNELTLNHAQLIETVQEAVQDFFRGEVVDEAAIRVSHTIKGRKPEAIHKPANQLLESDKTIYYERCAFSIDVPSIWKEVNGNRLNLSIVGVRAYNHTNFMSKKVPESIR